MLHRGVSVAGGVATDAARGVAVVVSGDGAPAGPPEVTLLAEQCARLRLSSADLLSIVARCLRRRTLAPLRGLRCRGRRVYPRPGLAAVYPGAVLATAKSALLVGLFAVAVAAAAGLAVAQPGPPLRAALVGTAVWWVSYAAHEGTHLWLVRMFSGGRRGAFASSWAKVWTVGPLLPVPAQRLVALGGPVCGALACLLLALSGVDAWICVLGGVVHASNLLPFAPDGRLVLAPRAA